MGTRFLAAAESMAVDSYKQMVVDHGPDDLIISSAITGTPASWLKPSLVACGLDPDNLIAPAGGKNYTPGAASMTRWKDVWAAGLGLGLIRAIHSVDTIVATIEREYVESLQRARSLSLLIDSRSVPRS